MQSFSMRGQERVHHVNFLQPHQRGVQHFSLPEYSENSGKCISITLSTDAESRILFVRRYWYAYSISELAKQFGLKSNTVSVRLSRIRDKLRDYLKGEGFTV